MPQRMATDLVQNLLSPCSNTVQPVDAVKMSTTSSAEWSYTASQADSDSLWTVEVFHSIDGLQDRWLRLTQEGQAGPFQTYGWVSSWYTAAAQHGLAQPLILMGSRHTGDHPDIIFPLCIYKQAGCTIISSPDLGVSDLYQPILSQSLASDHQAVRDFFQIARKHLPRHDLLSIDKLEASRDGGAPQWVPDRFLMKLPYSAWSLDLSQATSGTAEQLVKSKMRRTVRQKINQLEKVAESQTAFSHTLKDTDALAITWDMRADRFKSIERPDGLENEAWRHLYEEVCWSEHTDLSPFSAVLTCDGEPTATQLGIVYKDHFVGTLLSFNMGKYDRYSPGMQVVFKSIKHLADVGITRFDLSGGDQPYKKQFGCTARPLFQLLMPGSLKGAVIWGAWKAKNRLKRHPALLNTLKHIQGVVKKRH